MRLRNLLPLLLATTPAVADPVATVAPVPAPRETEAPGEPVAGPTAEQLATAPPADEASGIAVAPPRDDHPVANTVLALPRAIARVLLTGPRYAAGHVDDYLESRSPNAFGRDVHASWRFGATFEYERALGPDAAVRVGRELARATAIDGYVGLFGARGQSGGLRAELGSYSSAHVAPFATLDAGRDMDRAFAGIGSPGPLVVYEQKMIAGSAGVGMHAGSFGASFRGIYDRSAASDPSGRFVAAYNPDLRGFDETEAAQSAELSVFYDSRRPAYRWIRRAAPSTGFLFRATGGYTRLTATRTGDFNYNHALIETRKLFDLFNGDRVLSLGAAIEQLSTEIVPFDRIPTLGGRDRMRPFARDQLRGPRTAYVDMLYEWPLGNDSRGYLFAEAGTTSFDGLAALHGGYGGGIRFLSGASTSARIQLAGSETGDVAFFLQVGAL